MPTFPHLALFFTGEGKEWLTANTQPPQLLQSIIGGPRLGQRLHERDGVSTFEIRVANHETDWEHEAEVAAAWFTSTRLSPKNISVLRILQADVDAAGLRCERTNGELGIPSVDCLHVNIVGHHDGFEALVSRIYGAVGRGQDRLRKINKRQIEYHLDAFLKLVVDGGITRNGRNNLLTALGGVSGPSTLLAENKADVTSGDAGGERRNK